MTSHKQLLGPYELVAPIGAGGMGEVFRARDTRLDREVAIKILPKDFATDPDRLRRFEQESKTLAALNHPNILTIHDAGVQEGTPYLVSELLEGKTLREELNGGALPVRKATEHALQLAQGLAAAHGKGIIHRDLKPENIFVAEDGRVKILDFGLAKLREKQQAESRTQELPADPDVATLMESTEPGKVMGTPAYMSPEQVRGEPADHRSDIFSFGCVVYEMLSGSRPFGRDTPVQSMNAVLADDPPELTTRDPKIPAALERIVNRCLEKRLERRFQAASDLAFALENAGSFSIASLAGRRPGPAGPGARWMRALPWATAMLLGLSLALSFALIAHRRNRGAAVPGSATPVTKVPLFLPGSGSVMARSTVQVVISPDGRKLAYVNADGLWLFRLDRIASASRLVSGQGLSSPFWSPNSDEVGYFDEEKLYRTTTDGARPVPICNHVRFRSPHGEGAAWLPGNRIVFATGDGPLLETPASGGGGEPSVLLPLGPEDKDFEEPSALPEGRGVLFIAWSKHKRSIDLWTPDRRRKDLVSIRAGFQQPVYSSSGHVLFWRLDQGNEGIWAFPLSLERLERTADPFLVSNVGRVPSASFTGALVFALRQSEFFGIRQLVWLDRSGRVLGTVGEPIKGLSMPRLSPDGRQVVEISREAPRHSSIWLVDTATGGTLPFLQSSAKYFLNTAQWAGDGRQIIFMKQNWPDEFIIAAKSSDGTGGEQVVLKGPVGAVSPSGHYLFVGDPPDATTNVYVPGYIQLSDPARKVTRYPDAFKDIACRLSPDDRVLAFWLRDGEKRDVYLADFPSFKNRRLVSRGGGWYPEWKPDSQEIFFLGDNRRAMMSARRKPGTTEFEPPEKLFDIPEQIYNNAAASVFDVAPDGRFLMLKEVEDVSTEPGLAKANAQIVLNWFEEFREKK